MAELYDPTKPFKSQVLALVRQTHSRDGPFEVGQRGKRFSISMDPGFWGRYETQQATDGIGTKGLLHWEMDTVEAGVQDAVAMVWDDLIEHGYVPFSLNDHIIMEREDNPRLFRMVGELARLCMENQWEAEGRNYPVAITGGETAILNTLQGFEMGITGLGLVRKGAALEGRAQTGDAVIGLESSGVHSNGFTFLRQELFEERGMTLESDLPWHTTVGEELTIPTRLYLPVLKELLAQEGQYVHGMVHITGGGLTKLLELAPGKGVYIAVRRNHGLRPQAIFQYMHEELGQNEEQMAKRFNNGIGYAIAIAAERAQHALGLLRAHCPADVIGEAVPSQENKRGHVLIESPYSNATILCRRVWEMGEERTVVEVYRSG